ncbi:MAG: hypothetical protein DBY38_02415 [Clostridium cadaveris]|uniref:Phage minor capsid protein 2 n=1 Tax=Clostridium cadaveris TaxID=1529 RepID=A0A316MA32_9CLOT|nr:MAG: hypothetical protein DBY38_02415 [Clostridium cadaveris]
MDDEKNTQESVDLAQLLENAIMLNLIKEFKEVLKNDTQKQRSIALNNIRKNADDEINIFIKAMAISTLDVLNKNSIKVIKDLDKKNDLKHYSKNISNWDKKINKNIRKYVKSKGIVLDGQKLEKFFYNLCNSEIKAIVDGNITLENAIRTAIKKISDSGIKIITYENTTRNIDVFVRQELLYAQKMSAQDIRDKFSKENNITIFDIDAHPDARPSHQVWQGKRYDITGKYYPTFEELSHGNGSLNDYGCNHKAYPVTNPNDALMYTEEMLKNINTKPFVFRGKEYDGYKAKQNMRYLERQIRALKREKALLDKNKLVDKKVNAKLRHKQKEYREFCKAYNTYPRTNRTRVYTE